MGVVKRPYYGYETEVLGFKPFKGEWRFRFYAMKMLKCPRCHRKFDYYHGVSPSIIGIEIKSLDNKWVLGL